MTVSCQEHHRSSLQMPQYGLEQGDGTEIVYGDVLLDRGLVMAVGYIPPSLLDSVMQSSSTEIRVEDLRGAWVTPGLVDLHSHLGVYSAPRLSGEL